LGEKEEKHFYNCGAVCFPKIIPPASLKGVATGGAGVLFFSIYTCVPFYSNYRQSLSMYILLQLRKAIRASSCAKTADKELRRRKNGQDRMVQMKGNILYIRKREPSTENVLKKTHLRSRSYNVGTSFSFHQKLPANSSCRGEFFKSTI
jgi:hypothetical protein